jgi:hypothetical protein
MPDLIRHPDVVPTKVGNHLKYYRGRDNALVCATPPSEPDMRISRIRLSGQRFYLTRIGVKRDGHLQG